MDPYYARINIPFRLSSVNASVIIMPDTPIKRGLEGVVVTESDLSYIDGIKGILIYRGYSIEELAEKSSFEEVLYLLWHGTLPDVKSLTEFSDDVKNNR